MELLPQLKSEVVYARNIIKAGLDAASSAGKDQDKPTLARASQVALMSAALGIAVGALGVYLGRRDRNATAAVLGGLVGGALGFTGGVAWGTRERTRSAVHNAAHNVQQVRDAHWLEKHPVAYA
jgi:hypothetical protein